MDASGKLSTLLELAEECGITIRQAPAAVDDSHPGGALVRLRGREMLFLDPGAAVADQINVVAAALRGREALSDRFLPPEVRETIDGAPDAS